jgi:hypothetical protein
MSAKQDTSTRRPYSLTKELAEALFKYQNANKFSSEAEAVRSLVRLGLSAINNSPETTKA